MSLVTTIGAKIDTTITTIKSVISIGSKILAFIKLHWKFILILIIIGGIGYGVNQIINHFTISNLHNDIQHLQSTNTSLTRANTELGAEVKSGNDLASQFRLEVSRL